MELRPRSRWTYAGFRLVLPARTCTGCQAVDEKEKLLRVVRIGGRIEVDFGQEKPGRGAYVHADPSCISRAVKRGGLARALKTSVPAELADALLGDAKQGNESKA